MNLLDYQRAIGHATDPLTLVQTLQAMEPGWVQEPLAIARGMDAPSFKEWQDGLVRERVDVRNTAVWYAQYWSLLNPPVYAAVVELDETESEECAQTGD